MGQEGSNAIFVRTFLVNQIGKTGEMCGQKFSRPTSILNTTTNFTQPQSAQLESRAGYGLRSRALSLQHATVDTLRMRQPTGTTTDGNRDSKHNRINTTDWERDGRCSRRSRRGGGGHGCQGPQPTAITPQSARRQLSSEEVGGVLCTAPSAAVV